MTNTRVRVRFAPSPTGPLHIGGVRTALYNYLFAKKYNGDFILRIEDTDSNRFVPGAEEYIIKSLQWCGIQFNEGVSFGGSHSPYRQSERKEIYLKYALQLVSSGMAYYAFDTPGELDSLRKAQESHGKAFNYNFEVRTRLSTSINSAVKDAKERIERGDQYVIRFKMPVDEEIHMHDLIRGEVIVNSSTLDDKVLYKSSDGLPTYHLANIVDDYLMQISHVIRGEEWLPSLPLHVQLYKAFGWLDSMPKFAHLPLLLKPDGKGKLSKRDGDKLGFPVFPMHWQDPSNGEVYTGYDDFGFLPDAFINFLALLGWNPGTTQEIFNIDELTQAFSLDKVSKAGAKFDFEKAKWFNQQYIKAQSDEGIAKLISQLPEFKDIKTDHETLIRICSLVKDRMVFVKDFKAQASFFFTAPDAYDADVVKKRWNDKMPELLLELKNEIQQIADFKADTIKEKIHHFIETKQANMGAVMNCIRLSLVGGSFGPDLPVIMEILGKEEVIARIEKAVKTI